VKGAVEVGKDGNNIWIVEGDPFLDAVTEASKAQVSVVVGVGLELGRV
jgi:hypothetical protein